MASSDINGSFRRLNTIQERAMVCKQLVSELSHFLNTNDPLYPEFPGDMYSLARKGLEISREDLHYLDLVIINVESIDALDITRKLRFEIVASLIQLSTILHPIRSVPDDIILSIFQWCTDSHEYRPHRPDGYVGDYGSLDNRHPSWILSHVCRRWRHLALTSPSLWSVLNLSEHSLNRFEHIILPRLRLQLQRSGNAPLAVVIDDDAPCAMVLHGQDNVVSILRSTTHRWWYLKLSIQLPADVYDDDAVFKGCSFASLTHLVVRNDPDSSAFDIPVKAFRSAPLLTHVYSYGEYNIDVDWGNVKVYRTCLFCLAGFFELSSLQTLTVDATDDYERHLMTFQGHPPIELPRLLTLVLYLEDPLILNHLTMPFLETLHLQLSYYNPSEVPDLRQCSSRLRNLSIASEHRGNPQLLVSLFAGAPYVTSLYLEDSLPPSMAILRLNGTPDDLFPELESLRLDVSALKRSGEHEEVERLIQSRLCVREPKMKEVRLIGDMGLGHDQYLAAWEATFQKVRSLGIKVISTITNQFDT